MTSYAQNFEDVMLDRVFRDVETGFYVDVGANDPVHYSITKYFSLHGWRGINIEPSFLFEKVLQDRPNDINLNMAIANRRGVSEFTEFPQLDGWSSLSGKLPEGFASAERVVRQVSVIPLRDVFEEHGVTDIAFMSIDVEGAERDVLLSNDWSRWRPRVVLLEATLQNSPVPCHELWEDVILAADYLFAYFDGLNRFYVRAEDRQLLDAFKTPPNVFDYFQMHDTLQLRAEVERLHSAVAGLAAENGELRHQKDHLQSEIDRFAHERTFVNARLLGSDNPEDRAIAERILAAPVSVSGNASVFLEQIETMRLWVDNLKEEIAEQQRRKNELAGELERVGQERLALNSRLVEIEQGVGARSLGLGLWVARRLHAIGKLLPQSEPARGEPDRGGKKRAA